MRITEEARAWRGPLYHVCGGILVFLVWRIAGMPLPGVQGRLIPLAWVVLGLVSGRSGIPRYSAMFLGLFTLLAFLWRLHPAVSVVSGAAAVMGLFPGVMAAASGGTVWSLARAAAPLFLVSVLLVPFEGDEPHYATILSGMTGDSDTPFADRGEQIGDLATGETHHTKGFPLLLMPGYPMGQEGVRTVSFFYAIAAVMLIAFLFRRSGVSLDGSPAVMALLLMPGAGLLGLLYPGWVSMGLFVIGVLWLDRGRSSLPVILAVTLAMTAVKFRFFFLGAGLVLVWFLRLEHRGKWKYAAFLAAAAVAVLAVDRFLLGGGLFWARYGNLGLVRGLYTNVTVHTWRLLEAPFASFLDTESGLLWKAPWIILALAGIPSFRRRHPDLFLALGLPSLLYIVVTWLWLPSTWHSMPTPPGRIFMPLVPFLLASASTVLRKRPAWVLLWISMAVSALCTADPWLRFNHADGSDTLITLFTSGSAAVHSWLPEWAHPSLLPFLAWGLFTVLLVWLTLRSGRGVQWALLAAALVIGLASTGYPARWYAAGLDSANRNGCVVYPEDPDPLQRTFWLFRRAPLLAMGHHLDTVTLPVPSGEGAVQISIRMSGMSADDGSVPGIEVTSGGNSQTAFVDSPVRPTPSWVRSHMKVEDIGRLPENLADTLVTMTLEAPGDSVVLSADWTGGYRPLPAGLYIDWIELVRR